MDSDGSPQNRDAEQGICNGFQALIKLGLVHGEIREEISEKATTLTYNRRTSHVTDGENQVASVLSPWFANLQVGDIG